MTDVQKEYSSELIAYLDSVMMTLKEKYNVRDAIILTGSQIDAKGESWVNRSRLGRPYELIRHCLLDTESAWNAETLKSLSKGEKT